MNVISGFAWDLDRKDGRRNGVRNAKILNTFGQGLRECYRDVLDQGIPDNLLPLIKRLEQRERDAQPAAEG